MRRHGTSKLLNIDSYLQSKAYEYIANFMDSRFFKDGMYDCEEMMNFLYSYISESKLEKILGPVSSEDNDSLDPYSCRIKFGKHNKPSNFSALYESKDKIQTILFEESRLSRKLDESSILNNLMELSVTFSLNDNDLEVITFFYIYETCSPIKSIWNDFDNPQGHVALMKSIFGNNPKLSNSFPRSIQTLKKLRLLDDYFNLENNIKHFICGLSGQSLSANYFSISDKEPLPLEYFDSYQKHIETLKALILKRKPGEGVNILFYGIPGTGKTEFTRLLSKSLNYKLYDIKSLDDEGNTNYIHKRFTGIKAAMNLSNPDSSIIMIDEADEMLNGSISFFGWRGDCSIKNIINTCLDDSRHICIWITNRFESIDDSTRRRFNYSIEFQNLSVSSRIRIWENTLKTNNLENIFTKDEIIYLAKKYETNAGSINVSVSNFVKITDGERTRNLEIIEEILNSHLNIAGIKVNQLDKESKYSLEGLNINSGIPIKTIVSTVRKFSDSLTVKKNRAIKNMNLLLYGPSGTGKTEFAKYIARELDKELLVKRGSDLLDMYVGGTEKNIRSAFKKAETDKAILFIDEFEGLIGAREKAVRNWELTQVNELLAQMEEFKGILICASNHKEMIDSAAIRRFNFKLDFDYLNNDGKLLFYKLLLTGLTDKNLDVSEEKQLLSLDCLTPGDFKVVLQKHSFFDKGEVANSMLLDALKEEVNHKSQAKRKAIGF